MGRHREMRVEPSAEVTRYFNRLNINSANTDRTVMNFQQLLSRSDNKKFILIIVDLYIEAKEVYSLKTCWE